MSTGLAYQRQLEYYPVAGAISKASAPATGKAKPFVKWVGGKSQLIPALSARMPEDLEERMTTYIEPFIGGGAFFFWLVAHGRRFRRVVINDANPALVNAYQVIRDQPGELINLLQTLKKEYMSLKDEEARKAYYYTKREMFNSGWDTSLEHAAHLIFLNRTCFNGLYRVNSKGHFNVPHGRYTNPLVCDPETIRADAQALANVEIHCGDFADVLKYADNRSFVYFDPPYRPLSETSSFCSYCEGGFDDKEQRRLADCCRLLDAKGARWLLSNSDPKGVCPDDDFFERLYQGFHIHSVQASRMLNSNPNKRGKLSELLISNYPARRLDD